jgi:hypothetical protein
MNYHQRSAFLQKDLIQGVLENYMGKFKEEEIEGIMKVTEDMGDLRVLNCHPIVKQSLKRVKQL